MMLSKCEICGSKKSRFIKKQEASNLNLETPLNKIPLPSNILFWVYENKFLLVWDKYMPEMHLKQCRFTYSACGPFTKNKERNRR